MISEATEQSLLESINVYVRNFKIPNISEDLLEIASSILTFQQKQGSLAITPSKAESFIQKT